MHFIQAGFFTLIATAIGNAAWAQYRDGQPPVVPLPPITATVLPVDPSYPFARNYAAAGSPRILLMWNRTLDDQSATAVIQRDVIRDTWKQTQDASSRKTQGPAESANISESARDSDRTLSRTQGTVSLGAALRQTTLSERETRMIESAFQSALQRAGVQFIDRALAMRTTAATVHRAGADQQLIETDALLRLADLMMEVLLVPDPQAAVGYAFDVRVRDVQRGAGIANIYSLAIPPSNPQPPANWRAGPQGYELVSGAAPASPTALDIGQALAAEVMTGLTGRLSGKP